MVSPQIRIDRYAFFLLSATLSLFSFAETSAQENRGYHPYQKSSCIRIRGSDDQQEAALKDDLDLLHSTSTGKKIFQRLEMMHISEVNITIARPHAGFYCFHRVDPTGRIHGIDVEYHEGKEFAAIDPSHKSRRRLVRPSAIALCHELIHAIRGDDPTKADEADDADPFAIMVRDCGEVPERREAETIGLGKYSKNEISENRLLEELGLPLRFSHLFWFSGIDETSSQDVDQVKGIIDWLAWKRDRVRNVVWQLHVQNARELIHRGVFNQWRTRVAREVHRRDPSAEAKLAATAGSLSLVAPPLGGVGLGLYSALYGP